jgi:hypothetical protein
MKIAAIVFCLFPLLSFTQDITGVWTGYIKTPGSQLEYELAITGTGSDITAYSLLIYPKDGIENVGIKKAKIKQLKKEILIEDGELVYDNFSTQQRRVKMTCYLNLVMKDSKMILQGNFKTRSIDFRDTRTYEGEAYLEKYANPESSKMLVTLDEIKYPHYLRFKAAPKKQKPASPPVAEKTKQPVPLPVKSTVINPADRNVEKISEINFNSDSLVLNIYDNGTIDGDTVSIELNGKVINENVALKARAFRMVIPSKINPGDSMILVMHAVSLGLIPPNSGLIIIEDGVTRHEIRFSGDLKTSSAVILRKRKQQ